MKRPASFPTILVWASAASLAGASAAQEAGTQDLAHDLANPVSDLISVPFQFNFDEGLGTGDGHQSLLNIQPVIPFSISPNWNLISRTIVPIVRRSDLGPGSEDETGLGNITQSLFFSPKTPTAAGVIWGAGPVVQLPTANDGIAPKQWGAGLTAVVAIQQGPWTGGALSNHVWSISDEEEFGESSVTLVQPFLSHSTPGGTTFTLNSESTYDWEDQQWSVPVNFTVAQLVKAGSRPLQFQAGARYWLEAPESGPDGWALRLGLTVLFPRN
ncbi:hypothetical protein [Rhodobacter sp. CZR27]|uniref:hypothetical protein n=1 Tax=Rhodobacter sp. CZR27 TaxID=2033869 RepID=UPI000BBEA885|nr:hypothetical protein [Rhodobacter sp. CZR27]